MCFRHFLGKYVAKKLGPSPVGKKGPLQVCEKTRSPLLIGEKTRPSKNLRPQAVNSEP